MKVSLKGWPILALIPLCFAAGVWAMSSADEAAEVFHPTLTLARGTVAVKSLGSGSWEEAKAGMLLLSGDTLRTGKGSRARVEFPSGELEVYETTILVIPSVGTQARKKDIREVIVEEGKTLFDINPTGTKRGFEFRTRNIQGGVKGTLFTVSYLDGGTAVNVYRGAVTVANRERPGGSSIRLSAGKSIRVEKALDSLKIRTFDPTIALRNRQRDIPPGLDGRGFPADPDAGVKNRGDRKRVQGDATATESDSGNDSDSAESGDDDQDEDEK